MSRSMTIGSAAALLALAAGCAGPPAEERAVPETTLRSSMERSPAERIIGRVTNVENGLQVRRWIVQGDVARVGEALMNHGAADVFGEAQREEFRRNGLRLLQVPVGEVESIESALDPLALNLDEWHGQVSAWRELHERPVSADGEVVAVSGRVRSFEDGRFQLLIRSWVVPMEDVPFVHLDLVPCFARSARREALLLPARDERMGERFEALSVTLRLSPGMAYVLTSEAPGVAWPGEADESARPSPARVEGRRRMGPGFGPPPETVGPEAGAPVTLGTLLFDGQGLTPTRGVLVFLPRIAPEVFPPEAALPRGAAN